jgi:putative chitinase
MSINRSFFFSQVKLNLFAGTLSPSQTSGLTAVLDEWETNYAHEDDRWLAYMLATAHLETGRKMQGIEEIGKGKGHLYGSKIKQSGKPYTTPDKIYYGRGLVQLTWYENYEKAGNEIGKDFLNQPELALDIDNAVKVIFLGMMEGWFTGKKLSGYFNPTTEDWKNARRIINGLDKADLIADFGHSYYGAISHTV